MDLHLIPGAVATVAEREAINGALRAFDDRPVGTHGAGGPRAQLLPVLRALDQRIGYFTPGGLNYVCQNLGVPPAEAYGVATFYHLFAVGARPPGVAYVCDDIACRVNGAEELCRELAARLGPAGVASGDGSATWKRTPCLGQCERGPAALVRFAGEQATEEELTRVSPDDVLRALGGVGPTPASGLDARQGWASAPQTLGDDRSALSLLRSVGRIDPASLDEYRADGGYAALRRALEVGAGAVIREVNDAGLRGRGGAAFPTGRKWADVAHASARPHYVVCNADESEPGTFKDRVLMEENPFAIVEAMTIAGLATGSDVGYIYVRGEYPLAVARLEFAIASARAGGYLGPGIMGQAFSFEVEVRVGAGAYICGEETALFNSIEGFRGEPRNKPPFPTQSGLFGKPTLVNNVETLVNVLRVVTEGGEAFARIGTEQSTGTKLFCLSGCIERPGVYEVPFGATLREITALAGGVRGGRALQAVLLGGAAGTFVAAEDLDVPLTLEGTRAIGASLGSGVVMVFDETVDMIGIVRRIAAFFRDESCGQCVPCRVGTERIEEAVGRLALGQPLESTGAEAFLIDEIGQAMRDASICGLGQTAALAVQSAVTKLRLFEKVKNV